MFLFNGLLYVYCFQLKSDFLNVMNDVYHDLGIPKRSYGIPDFLYAIAEIICLTLFFCYII